MEKRKGLIGRIILIVIIYSFLTHWSDFKRGVIDGFNDGRAITANTKPAK